jgi:hypothetical protein
MTRQAPEHAETLTRKMPFAPKTANDEDRTIDLVASTGAGVDRDNFEGHYREVLEISRSAIDLTALDGMPLLNAHRREGIEDVLGVVQAARIEGGQLIVTVQFSERHEAIWKDVKAGIIRNVSMGYEIQDFEDATDEATGAWTRTITRWRPVETSLVPIGADAGAKSRSNTMPKPATTAALPAVTTEHTEAIAERAAKVERERCAAIYDMGRHNRMDEGFTRKHIDAGTTSAAFGRMVLDRLAERSEASPIDNLIRSTEGEAVDLISEALYATRVNPRHKLSERARPFAQMTSLDIARNRLDAHGVSTRGLSQAETITRAMTTSDFPLILANTFGREMRIRYMASPAALKLVARETTAPDFKAKSKLMLGEAPTLEKVNEHGEFHSGGMAEAGESYALATYGKIVGLSRQAIINDDLGAFADLTARFGQSAADFEDQFLCDLLTTGGGVGPTMSDVKALFHSDHGNLAGAGAVISVTTLTAARLAMRRQTGLSGKAISVRPKYLVVPPELETTAEQLLAALAAATSDDVNPFSGKLQLVVASRLSDPAAWYLAADPAEIDGLEYAYLDGLNGPEIFTEIGFEVDGMKTKCRLDFGAGFLDWRGWYRNPGA